MTYEYEFFCVECAVNVVKVPCDTCVEKWSSFKEGTKIHKAAMVILKEEMDHYLEYRMGEDLVESFWKLDWDEIAKIDLNDLRIHMLSIQS